MTKWADYYQLIDAFMKRREAFVQVTLVDAVLSVPQEVGAKMLVTANGLAFGTVGGGRLEAAALRYAQEMLRGERQVHHQLLHWNLKNDIGMTCGGNASLFFDAHFHDRWRIAVFGAGHVAQALVKVLSTLDCHVTCVDPREEWLAKLPQVSNVELRCMTTPADLVTTLPSDTYIVSMTQGHAYDLPILERILRERVPPFIGVIGSDAKAVVLRRDLIKLGIERRRVESIYCPIGLAIGSRDPSEIAISIVAQLLQVRDQLAKDCSRSSSKVSGTKATETI